MILLRANDALRFPYNCAGKSLNLSRKRIRSTIPKAITMRRYWRTARSQFVREVDLCDNDTEQQTLRRVQRAPRVLSVRVCLFPYGFLLFLRWEHRHEICVLRPESTWM